MKLTWNSQAVMIKIEMSRDDNSVSFVLSSELSIKEHSEKNKAKNSWWFKKTTQKHDKLLLITE